MAFPVKALDAFLFGIRVSLTPPSSPGQITLGGMSENDLTQTHQWQYDGSQTTPNDCVPTCLAMVIHQARLLQRLSGTSPRHGELARAMDSPPLRAWRWYRVPAAFPHLGRLDVRGATPPGGAAAAFNRFAALRRRAGEPFEWRAACTTGNSFQQLIGQLAAGFPTILFGVENRTPHAVVPVGYAPGREQWLILDPGYAMTPQNEARFHWSCASFAAWWGERHLAFRRYTMVIICPGGSTGTLYPPS